MRKSHPIIMAALAGVIAASANQLPAGEPGIVRISDSRSSGVTAQTEVIPASAQYTSQSQGGCSNCGGGGCGASGCSTGNGGKHCFGKKHSPDHGWGRPIKRPINRLPVMYQRYWPNAWHGQQGAGYYGANVNYHPAVYMPTDTTQLGYYYQSVPFWRPNPSMTPPVPWPSQWHKRECGATPFARGYGNSTRGAGGCGPGGCGVSQYGQPAGDYNSSPALQPVPDAPAESQEPPPAPQTLKNDTAFNQIP